MKIAHISDLHFGLNNEHIVHHFLSEISQVNPDIILISGDLTQRATSEQFKSTQEFLQQLPGKLLIVPGNHDIPLYNIFTRLLNPFKRYKHFINSKLTTTFEDEGLRILGVNTVNRYAIKDGWLSLENLDLIRDYFSPTFNGLSVLFFHHNFDYMEGWHKPLENYQTFLNYLLQSPIDIVCTGHLHYANVNLLEKLDEKACLLLHAGSLLCPRTCDGLNSYYLLSGTGNSYMVDWRIFDKEGFKSHNIYHIDFNKTFPLLRQTLA